MMNIFHFNLLFSAWRSRSVTISLVFALAMQGIWAGVHLREFFRSAGMYWFQVWILPFIIVWLFAKYEPKLLPSDRLRKYVSYGLIIASLVFGGTLARYQSKGAPVVPEAKPDTFKKLGTKPSLK